MWLPGLYSKRLEWLAQVAGCAGAAVEALRQHHLQHSGRPAALTAAQKTENGACRKRHADVIELLWFLNSWGSDLVYGLSYGDKDTFSLAFSLAGKPEQYYQVGPRGAALRSVECSCTSCGRVAACHPCWQARAGPS